MKNQESSNFIILWGIILILIISPILRGAVDISSICFIYLIVISCFFLFIFNLILNKQSLYLSGLELPLFSIFLLSISSYFFSIYPEQSKKSIALFFCYIIIFIIIQNFFSTRKKIHLLCLSIIITGVFLSLLGLIQYAVSMGTPSWKVFLSSTYVNRNHFAGYLELCLPLSIGMVGYFKDRGKRGILIYGIILMVISLILTLSRGGWIAAGTALFFMAFLAWKKGILSKKVWTLSVITLIITFVFILGLNPLIERISTFGDLVKEPLTFEKRVIVWKGTMGIIKDNPFLGSGIGTFSYAFPCYRPPGIINKFQWAHNDFLHFTSEMGILFLPLMFWLIFSAFKMGVTTFYKTESRLKRGISFGCTTGILALFIHSIFDFNLHIPANTILFFTFLGMIGAVSKPGGLRY